MKTITLLMLAILVVTGCNEPGCELEGSAAKAVANVLVTTLQCANPVAVERDMTNLVSKVGLCSKDPKKTGPIAMLVCPILSNFAVNQINIQGRLPKDWGCSAENATKLAKLALTTGCNAIPF